MIAKIKEYALLIMGAALGILYTIFRINRAKLDKAESDLARANFNLTTKENDIRYGDAKNHADSLVNDYKSARRSTPE